MADGTVNENRRGELHQAFLEFKLPAIVNVTFFFISADHDTDNCMVQHANAMLLEYVKSIAAPDVTFHTHFARSDGCKAQFKCAQHFLWITKQHAETGTRVKWSFSCSCHGKDRVDSENGRAKHACRCREEFEAGKDETKSIRTSKDMYEFLSTELRFPARTIEEKQMCGIFRRHAFYIPLVGPGKVNRNVPGASTLENSSKLHEFEDCGRPGIILTRPRSCHQCSECLRGKSYGLCRFQEDWGRHELVANTPIARLLTRSAMAAAGLLMSEDLQKGDFLACEIDSHQEPYMIGCCDGPAIMHAGPDEDTWMGTIKAGDKIVWVYKLEGSTAIKTLTTKRVPVFREDIRVVKFKMKEIVPARTSARLQEGMTGHAACKKFELSRVVFDEILRGLPTDINIPLRGQPK